jgi:hypothetical protein
MKLDSSRLVASELTQHPDTRDNDFLLSLNIWVKQMGKISKDEWLFLRKLLTAHNEKKISNFETIRRTRQKLQEENPSLRGRKYHDRQNQAEKFRKEIVK